MTDQPVVVALNGQINPNNPGGTESSVMSVARFIGPRKDAVSLKFISLPKHSQAVRAGAPDASEVIDWPFPMSMPAMAPPESTRVRRIRKLLGPARPLFDAYYERRWRRRIAQTMPRAADCDAILGRHGVEVIHFGWPAVFPTQIPFVYEPQDLQHRHYPEFFSPETLEWRDQTYGWGSRNARYVVCGTWWTKHDIMAEFGVPSEQIAVVPRASVNARADASPEREAEIVREYGLEGEYGFYPAMTFPHKNHARLIEAIAYARDKLGTRIELVCTGRKLQPVYDNVVRLIEELGLADRVKFLGPVPDDVLSIVYARARMLVFPSLFEGLSQSILEGLNLGLPVIGAKQSSIPETVGRAGAFFDGEDVESIARTLADAVTDRAKLAEYAGAARAERERYDWTVATETLIALYRSAAGRPLTPEQSRLIEGAIRLDP
jgi:glycosyltransferase involved in cell wall biosynthesis